MKYILTESQLLRVIKRNKKIECDKCGWSWKLSEGGDDPYKCHKCGHQNKSPKKREEKEGVGAYAAPAFEMEPDHTTFKHQQKEGLQDTSWENDEGDKVTLVDLLDVAKDIPVKKISVEKLKPKLLSWHGDKKEIAKIESADLQYPILIFVDDNNRFISIIDGHHRAQKAVRNDLKTIKAKLIPLNSLPKKLKKVFSHLDKQEKNEGELTERCWKGYTQKGMKTMFGKRYPNCVKSKK